MKINNTKTEDIDGYIKEYPKDVQLILAKIRDVIKKAAPEAEETIKYSIPTFTLNGNLVHFAAYKNHIGFYPAPSGIKAFKKELSVYKNSKGAVQFPLNKPLPVKLISKIVKFRVKENIEKAVNKKSVRVKSKPQKKLKTSDKNSVTEHIAKLDPETGKIVEAIRQIILSTDKEIGERIKWNNPGFYYTGEMKPFDPKEYKREIMVFNLYKGRILMVFPGGAKVNDKSGLLEGDYKDGRRITVVKDMKDLRSKEKSLRKVIKDFIKLVDK